jgi:dipeptidyl aminopeptidase/acylaminoacyl peptidase
VHRVVGGERAVTGYDAAEGTLAFTVTSPTEPPELCSLVDGVERRLTHHQDGFLAAHPALGPEHFTVGSSDGCDIDAWLIRPAGFTDGGSYPVLLNVHGGPHTQYGNRWFDEFQLYAGAGFAVLYCNPHGSTGGAEHYARSIISPKSAEDPGTGWGGIDYDDVMAVLDAALERFPSLDGGRVGIMGGSYGGYMTSWAIGHTDRFAAACSERACNNLMSLEWSSDAAGYFRFEMGVSHLDDPDEYARMSPITYVKDIRTPVLILHSENDLRCPIEQADCLFVALRLLRREVDYYRFPAESHELTRGGSPSHRKQRADLIIDWFGRRLLAPQPRERAIDLAHDPERLEDPIHH